MLPLPPQSLLTVSPTEIGLLPLLLQLPPLLLMPPSLLLLALLSLCVLPPF